jgi:hypothetical protein
LLDCHNNTYLRKQAVILFFVVSSAPPFCLGDLTRHKRAQTYCCLSQEIEGSFSLKEMKQNVCDAACLFNIMDFVVNSHGV